MSIYRFFRLNNTGQIVSFAEFSCETDEAAYERARYLTPAGEQSEVWEGTSRRLGVISSTGKQRPANAAD